MQESILLVSGIKLCQINSRHSQTDSQDVCYRPHPGSTVSYPESLIFLGAKAPLGLASVCRSVRLQF